MYIYILANTTAKSVPSLEALPFNWITLHLTVDTVCFSAARQLPECRANPSLQPMEHPVRRRGVYVGGFAPFYARACFAAFGCLATCCPRSTLQRTVPAE